MSPCTSTPVVHVPEKLQVELVEGVVDLLPVALHQLCVVHQLLLRRSARKKKTNTQSLLNSEMNHFIVTS